MSKSEIRKYLSGKSFLISSYSGTLSFSGHNVRLYPLEEKSEYVPWYIFPVPKNLNPENNLYYIINLWPSYNAKKMDDRFGNSLSFTGMNAALYPNDSYSLVQWQIINIGWMPGNTPRRPDYDDPVMQIMNHWVGHPGDKRIGYELGVKNRQQSDADVMLFSPSGGAHDFFSQWIFEPFPY